MKLQISGDLNTFEKSVESVSAAVINHSNAYTYLYGAVLGQ